MGLKTTHRQNGGFCESQVSYCPTWCETASTCDPHSQHSTWSGGHYHSSLPGITPNLPTQPATDQPEVALPGIGPDELQSFRDLGPLSRAVVAGSIDLQTFDMESTGCAVTTAALPPLSRAVFVASLNCQNIYSTGH